MEKWSGGHKDQCWAEGDLRSIFRLGRRPSPSASTLGENNLPTARSLRGPEGDWGPLNQTREPAEKTRRLPDKTRKLAVKTRKQSDKTRERAGKTRMQSDKTNEPAWKTCKQLGKTSELAWKTYKQVD